MKSCNHLVQAGRFRMTRLRF